MRFQLDLNAVGMGVWMPLLLWGMIVVVVTASGYPGVVCVTPVAWTLAFAVGQRVQRVSSSLRPRMLLEAALAGGIFGFWQGMLFAAGIAVTPLVSPSSGSDLPNPFFTAALMIFLSVPVTAGLSTLMAWLVERREPNHLANS